MADKTKRDGHTGEKPSTRGRQSDAAALCRLSNSAHHGRGEIRHDSPDLAII